MRKWDKHPLCSEALILYFLVSEYFKNDVGYEKTLIPQDLGRQKETSAFFTKDGQGPLCNALK